MTRVHVFVEGQTEETFVRDLLYDYFQQTGIFLNPILVRTSSTGKGGVVGYGKIRDQLNRKCREDPKAFVTTMFDYFRLPKDFPGKTSLPTTNDSFMKAEYLERQLTSDIDLPNFFPNLLVHEFEGLLYSDPLKFETWFGNQVVSLLMEERRQFETPEHVNDGPETAPSKRILRHCPGYQKPLHGPLIALDIGLDVIRGQCRHFDAWLNKIEALA